MNALSNLQGKLARSKKYRESFAASVVKRMIPLQIRVLRKQREWSQARLATESKLTQGVISRAEDPDYGNLTVNTLVRVGAGFDCAFVGRFVSFNELARWYTTLADEKALEVSSFAEEIQAEQKTKLGRGVAVAKPETGALKFLATAKVGELHPSFHAAFGSAFPQAFADAFPSAFTDTFGVGRLLPSRGSLKQLATMGGTIGLEPEIPTRDVQGVIDISQYRKPPMNVEIPPNSFREERLADAG